MKRFAELRDLSDDHHRALVLAKRAKETVVNRNPDAVKFLWAEIRREYDSHLATHFSIEEMYLLPPICAAGGDIPAQRVRRDHAVLRAQVSNGPHDAETLAVFAQQLSSHVRFEERELFPFAEANLTAADLLRVAQAHRDAKLA